MAGGRKVTIHDVARCANVSPSTVSLVVHDRPNVSEARKRQVWRVMEELGYRPRNHRRAAARPITAAPHIAVLHSPREYRGGELVEQMQAYLRGINQAIERKVRRVTILAGGDNADTDASAKYFLNDGDLKVDGAIVVGVRPEDGYLDLLVDNGIPFVAINRRSAHGEFSSVCTDNFGAGRQVIDHLVSLGHQRIAVVTCDIEAYDYAMERWIGCGRALARHGLKPSFHMDDKHLGSWPDPWIKHLCREIIASGSTALFCSDFLAIRVIDELERRGKKVPRDFSIVGFDCLDISSSSGLQPTSISFDREEIGSMSADNLIELCNARSSAVVHRSLRVSTQLVERGTTGPCLDSEMMTALDSA